MLLIDILGNVKVTVSTGKYIGKKRVGRNYRTSRLLTDELMTRFEKEDDEREEKLNNEIEDYKQRHGDLKGFVGNPFD